MQRILADRYRRRFDYRGRQRGGHVAVRGIAAKIGDEIVRIVAGSGVIEPSLKDRDLAKEIAHQIDGRNRGCVRELLCGAGQKMFVHVLVEQRGDALVPPEHLKQRPRDEQGRRLLAAPREIRDDGRRKLHEERRIGAEPACHDIGQRRGFVGRKGRHDLHRGKPDVGMRRGGERSDRIDHDGTRRRVGRPGHLEQVSADRPLPEARFVFLGAEQRFAEQPSLLQRRQQFPLLLLSQPQALQRRNLRPPSPIMAWL